MTTELLKLIMPVEHCRDGRTFAPPRLFRQPGNELIGRAVYKMTTGYDVDSVRAGFAEVVADTPADAFGERYSFGLLARNLSAAAARATRALIRLQAFAPVKWKRRPTPDGSLEKM